MGSRVRDILMAGLDQLRYEPSPKWVRATLGEHSAADSHRPMLVWEPRRVVPSYAVPEKDIRAEITTVAAESDQAWSYEAPLHDAADVAGLVAFFDERVDLLLDGVAQDRPVTPWSPRARQKLTDDRAETRG